MSRIGISGYLDHLDAKAKPYRIADKNINIVTMSKTPKFVKVDHRQRRNLTLPQFVADNSDLLDTHNKLLSLQKKMTAKNETGKCAFFNLDKNTGISSIIKK